MKPLSGLLLSLFLCVPARAQSVWTLRFPDVLPDGTRPAGKAGRILVPAQEFNNDGSRQTFLSSADGITWTKASLPPAPEGLFCLNGRFLGLDSDGFWISDDGVSSTKTVISYNGPPGGAAAGNNVWMVPLFSGHVLRSVNNGLIWTSHPTPAATLGGIAFGNGHFVVSVPSPPGCLISPDGLSWTIGPAVPGGDLCFANGLFRTTTHFSENGETWTPFAGPAIEGVIHLRAGTDSFLTWTEEPQPQFYSLTGAGWSAPAGSGVLDFIAEASLCGNLWVAVTGTGKIITSPASAVPPPAPQALTIVPAVQLKWPGETGRLYVVQGSSDQSTWTDITGTLTGTGSSMEYTAPVTETRAFFRVQVR